MRFGGFAGRPGAQVDAPSCWVHGNSWGRCGEGLLGFGKFQRGTDLCSMMSFGVDCILQLAG